MKNCGNHCVFFPIMKESTEAGRKETEEGKKSLPSASGQCQVCEVDCDGLCANCKLVSYCCREHQLKDWRTGHRYHCYPASVEESKDLGRHLVASRDIMAGEVFLRELPFMTGPNTGHGHLFELEMTHHPICLGCFQVVRSGYLCSYCKWPMCSINCERNEDHANFECEIFSMASVEPFSPWQGAKYQTIFVLRCLLLQKVDPAKWEQFIELGNEEESEVKVEPSPTGYLTRSAEEFINEVCGLDQEPELIHKVSSILCINAIGSNDRPSTYPNRLYRAGSYLYYTGRLISHNCIPNAVRVIKPGNSELHVKASTLIRAGDVVSIMLAPSVSPVGTRTRREHLKTGHFRNCVCSRCQDPTEHKTFLSAIKCANESCGELSDPNSGYLIAQNPMEESSTWICNHCGDVKEQTFIANVIAQIKQKHSQEHISDVNTNLGSIDKLERLLAQNKGVTLHPTHHFIYNVEFDIVQRVSCILASSTVNSEVTRAKLAEKLVANCRKCLEVSEILFPGYNNSRGRLLYFLQQGLLVLSLREIFLMNKRRNYNAKPEARKRFEDILKIRRDGTECLSLEPKGREEFLLAQAMRDDAISDIKNIKKFFQIK